jgi:peptidoglycan/LPS O-acetylase OafA/YrhL
MSTSVAEKGPRFEILDIARFCAALSVVLFHYQIGRAHV